MYESPLDDFKCTIDGVPSPWWLSNLSFQYQFSARPLCMMSGSAQARRGGVPQFGKGYEGEMIYS